MSNRKPQNEVRNLKMTIMISSDEKELIDTLHVERNISRVQIIINALRDYEKKHRAEQSRQTTISLTDEKDFR